MYVCLWIISFRRLVLLFRVLVIPTVHTHTERVFFFYTRSASSSVAAVCVFSAAFILFILVCFHVDPKTIFLYKFSFYAVHKNLNKNAFEINRGWELAVSSTNE